jgi:transposase
VEKVEFASREELIAVIAAQQEQIEVLAARVQQLEEENRRLRGGGGKDVPAWVKPNRPKQEKGERKRRGQAFVRRREEPDEIHEHAMELCPDCGRKLCGGWKHGSHQVIELILPQVRVIEHVTMARWCGMCRKRWIPSLPGSELGVQGRRRFGVSVQSTVAALHGSFRVPIKQLRRLLQELWGLRISDGAIVALLDGVAQAGSEELARLHDQVRSSPVVCVDETGWRQNGQNGWLWTFATPQVRYFQYRKTRGGIVAEEVLGKEFQGKTVCDFYAAYNRLLNEIQRCWAHLLRDLHVLKEKQADCPEVIAWAEAVKRVYEEAKAQCARATELQFNQLQRRRLRERFEGLLEKLAGPAARKPNAPHAVLAHRIMKHLGELFVFVEHPEVPADNNLAERSLRPAVTARKVSGGTRSAKGSTTKMALLSHFGTWTLQNRDLLTACRNLLLAGSPA